MANFSAAIPEKSPFRDDTEFRTTKRSNFGQESTVSKSKQTKKELKFEDFMPHEEKTGMPINPRKAGSLHFHLNTGGCFDSVIQEHVHSFVPKHKSYLKDKDLKYVTKPTKEEKQELHNKQNQKTNMDILYEKIAKEQTDLEKEDRNIEAKVDCRWKNDSESPGKKTQVIKSAQIFQTHEEQ